MPKSKASQPRISRFLRRLWEAEAMYPVMAGNPRNFNWHLTVESKPATSPKASSMSRKKVVHAGVK
jgi:hypothetical protein